MKEAEAWRPTKFVVRRGRLRGSRDPAQLSVGSRLIADLVAGRYEEALRRHAFGRLLDLGCGEVPLFGAYREFVSDVVCVDWGGGRAPSRHLDLEWDLSDRLPFDDGSFDTIVLSDVLEHLPYPGRCWDDMARLLKPGGKILLNVPYLYPLHERPHDYFRYSDAALSRFARDRGLAIASLEAIGGAPEALADLVSKMLTLSRFGRWPARAIQSLCALLIATSFGKRISRATAAAFPLGYFMVAEKPASGAGAAA